MTEDMARVREHILSRIREKVSLRDKKWFRELLEDVMKEVRE